MSALFSGFRGRTEPRAAGAYDTMRLVILPQALRTVLPRIVNTFFGPLKDATLVTIVSVFNFPISF
ncbi:hypothetical protein [Bosea sp. CRIB-10]|uniref:hypothetical protein n=1 Tax=Bosea sp. CRIB-10 TaxID=378404 RepID=UPI001113D6CF|nr:hypothetical protein [Bosea sp. CRIB-10]